MDISFDLLKGKQFSVAVSGGSDSLALLNLLIDAGFQKQITVLHFDHNLREESSSEASWLESMCEDMSVQCIIEKWKNPSTEGNLQQQARHARYDFFKNYCEEKGLDYVLVGHTMDDVAETFLMRLARGSGLAGLSSMEKESNALGVHVLRPLLHVGREQLKQYLTDKNVKYISDPSNENEKFFRIRIRKLKEKLEESGLTYSNIRESALSLRRANDALNYYAEHNYNKMFSESKRNLSLDFLHEPLETQLKVLERTILFVTSEGLAPRTTKRIRALKAMSKQEKRFTLGGVIFSYTDNAYNLEIEKKI